MIDERFAAKEFATLGHNTSDSRKLANELGEEVNAELHQVAAATLKRIVGCLNDMGHELRIDEFEPGSIGFRDDYEDDNGYNCKLRLGLDTVITSIYTHLGEPMK